MWSIKTSGEEFPLAQIGRILRPALYSVKFKVPIFPIATITAEAGTNLSTSKGWKELAWVNVSE